LRAGKNVGPNAPHSLATAQSRSYSLALLILFYNV
jgi:hypothetical protein